MRNVSDEVCRENQNTFCVQQLFFRKSYSLRDNVKKNVVQRGRPPMTTWRMLIACWIPKATNTHSEYVIVIAFSTAIIDAQPRLNVTLYVRCLSFYCCCKVYTKCWLQIPNPSLWGMLCQLIVLLLSLSGTTCIENFGSKISGSFRNFEGPTKESEHEY